MYDIDLDLLPNITYDANGNILLNGAPIPNTPSVNLDNTNIFSTTNDAGQAYVPAGAGSDTGGDPTLGVDYTDAMAMLNSPFAQTDVFSSSKLDGFDDVTGDPSLFEDLLIQGAGTRVGLNEAANTISNNTDTLDGGAGTDTLDGSAGTDTLDGGAGTDIIPTTYTTATDLMGVGKPLSGETLGGRVVQNVQDNPNGTFTFVLNDGAIVTYDNQGNIVANPGLEAYQYDGTGPFIIRDDIDLYDATSDTFGNTSIEDIVTFLESQGLGGVGQQFKNQLGSFANAQQIEDSFFNQDMAKRSAFRNLLRDFDLGGYLGGTDYQAIQAARDAAIASANNASTDNTGNTGIDFEGLYYSLLNQQNQQNQPSNQTGSGDMSGLMGLINQFMQSRNSLQGGGRYNNMYGGGMGYGNPFNSGMGYGYGMNPYAGGIGSFYGNTGLGFSPSGYNSGYGSGYGMNNMFYGGYGGNNYNQQQMAYNPYSSLYNQLSNPQTYGYSGDVYTPEYNSYLNTPFEGNRYSQGYQDYLQQNNPGVYTNLFGGAV